jgi:4-amino-4-deoxy-L-arabinose transferase-like glycosyltransferase
MKQSLIYIIILICISAFFVFIQFNQIPKYLSFDEVEFAKLALSLDGKAYVPYSLLATGHATLYFYIILASFKIFGINSFALRFPSALFGVLNIPLFYLVLKTVYVNKKKLTSYFLLLTSLLLITSRWYLNFARFGFEPTFLLFLELLSLYYLLKYLHQKKNMFLIISGIWAGLAYNSYTPGRVFFILPLLVLIFFYLKSANRVLMRNILYFLIPLIILIIPINLYFTQTKDTRIDQLFFLRNKEESLMWKLQGLGENIVSTTGMFFVKGDMNGRHNYPGKPALNPIIAVFFLVGLFIAIKRRNLIENQIFLLFFFLSLLPALLTYPWENPNMVRTYTSIPAIVYFVGSAGIFIIEKYKKTFIPFIFVILLLISSFYEMRTYFIYQSTVFKQSFNEKGSLKVLLKMK